MGSYKMRLIGGRLLALPVFFLLPPSVFAVLFEQQFDTSMLVLIVTLVAMGFVSWKLEVTAREIRDGR